MVYERNFAAHSLELTRREDATLSPPSVFLHATNTKSRDSPVKVAECVALQVSPQACILESASAAAVTQHEAYTQLTERACGLVECVGSSLPSREP